MVRRLIITSITGLTMVLLFLAPAPGHAGTGGDQGQDSDHETIVHVDRGELAEATGYTGGLWTPLGRARPNAA